MKTQAAVFREVGRPWTIETLELDQPRPTEVLVKMEYAGLCHSDDHNITGDFAAPPPVVGGHEGAGRVVAVGDSVTRVAVGDSVVVTATPSCGVCKYCLGGRGWLCDSNAYVMTGRRPDGSARLHDSAGAEIGSFAQVGTFSEHNVIDQTQLVPFDSNKMPYSSAAIVSCAVITGWGGAVKAAGVRTGDVVVVVGVGGVGIAAVQGARNAGATVVAAIDQVAMKREAALKLGATHAVESIEAARELLSDLTGNVMADSAIINVGVLSGSLIGEVDALVAKGGRTVLTSVARWNDNLISMPINGFLLSGKSLVGNIYGSMTRADIADLIDQVGAGRVDVASMITTEYGLHEINKGYRDMHAGVNIRGVIRF